MWIGVEQLQIYESWGEHATDSVKPPLHALYP